MNIGGDFLVHAKKGTQAGSTTRGLGDLTWTTSADHVTNVSHYEGYVQAENSSTNLKTIYLGKPGSSNSVSVRVNIAGILNALAAGNYNVVVVAINGDGSSTQAESNTFTVPLTPE
jgi:hypothetical protein